MSEVGREQQVRGAGTEETGWEPITALLNNLFTIRSSIFESLNTNHIISTRTRNP